MQSDRRALILGAVLAAGSGAHAEAAGLWDGWMWWKKPSAPLPDDIVLGHAQAPVTVIEYASASCPHCARWALNEFPAFRKTYIDTGKVRFVFREFLTEPVGLAVAGFLIARRAGQGRYFQVVHDVFAAQPQFYAEHPTATPVEILHRIGKANGLTQQQVDDCLKDQAAIDALFNRVKRYTDQDRITSTPTFVVGSARFEGESATPQLIGAVEAALKAPRAKASRRKAASAATGAGGAI